MDPFTKDPLMLNGGGQVGQQGNLAGPFDGDRQFPLVFGAISADPPGDDLSPLGSKMFQGLGILIIDDQRTIGAKTTNLPAGEYSFSPFLLDHGLFSFLFCFIFFHFRSRNTSRLSFFGSDLGLLKELFFLSLFFQGFGIEGVSGLDGEKF